MNNQQGKSKTEAFDSDVDTPQISHRKPDLVEFMPPSFSADQFEAAISNANGGFNFKPFLSSANSTATSCDVPLTLPFQLSSDPAVPCAVSSVPYSFPLLNPVSIAKNAVPSVNVSNNELFYTFLGETKPVKKNADKECDNCHVTYSPLWRRSGKSKFLCNACGLYLKRHGKNRVISKFYLKSESKERESCYGKCTGCGMKNILLRKDKLLCDVCETFLK